VTGIGLVEDDVWYYTMPFHTIAGMGMQIALLCLGNTIVLPFAADPAKALDAFLAEKVTVVGQTPTFYLQIMQAPKFKNADLTQLRRAITYGGTMPRAMFEAFATVAPSLEWVTLWSQSELTQTPTIGRFRSLDDIPNQDPAWIGRPTAQLEVRVVDLDGNDAAEGELICRSPGVMRGYHKNPERTAEVLRDGWLHTGDNVRVDGAGNLYFVDRQKDMIKTGGMNVSSVEVERVLYQHPAVLEAAVVGVADDYWAQLVTAYVVARPNQTIDPEQMRTFCKEQLAGYKVPKQVNIVESLPKDTQGKILKRELRRQDESAVAVES
jgi:acyl-CoA synthetase (AMP-forming)/AMP-acid ligase II